MQQKTKSDGSSAELSWEKFPYVGLSKTYCADYMVPDSAATASAMYSGQKTTFFTMGYDSSVEMRKPSSASKDAEVETILDWAQAAGKKTGFVTTTRMSHATPAALYAKSVYRFWEGDKDILIDIYNGTVSEDEIKKNNVTDITLQLVKSEAGKKIDIMLGGGKSSFLPESEKPNNLPRWDYEKDEWDNYRQDNRNLINEWKDDHPDGSFISTIKELSTIDSKSTSHVMGIFTNSYVSWDDEAKNKSKPTLTEMATAAVKFLKAKAGDDGFFIMIEGGRIDAAHHLGHAVRALSETLAFDKAIEDVLKLIDLKETLVIVTADHAHTMSIGGYTPREVSITGTVFDDWKPEFGDFTVLSYGNGPGFTNLTTTGSGDYKNIDRKDVLPGSKTELFTFRQASASPLDSETHGGDDVGIWSAGPWSHLVHGTHQQSYIASVMSYSACLGQYKNREGCNLGINLTPNIAWIVVFAIYSYL